MESLKLAGILSKTVTFHSLKSQAETELTPRLTNTEHPPLHTCFKGNNTSSFLYYPTAPIFFKLRVKRLEVFERISLKTPRPRSGLVIYLINTVIDTVTKLKNPTYTRTSKIKIEHNIRQSNIFSSSDHQILPQRSVFPPKDMKSSSKNQDL